MKETQCKNQAELDAALKSGEYPILIGDAFFEVRDSSQVTACGSSQVTACGSSQVTAYGSSQVTAYGSSQVTACGSSQVRAYGSSQVRAYGSSQVTACGSSQVRAYGSSQVRAYGSSQVTAYDSSQVRASKFVAVTKQISHAGKISGGKVIKIISPKTAMQWLSFYGVEVKNGAAVLYKGVSAEFKANHNGFDYTPGTIPVAPDWDGGARECGSGLHFSPRPFMSLEFYSEAKKFIACPVKVKDMRAPKPSDEYPNKIKARGCCAPVWEVDQDGNKI